MAGDNNIPITFSAGNSDLAAYIDKLRVQAMDLNGQLLAATKLQADTAREQLKLINDQIQAMSRKNALGAMAARETGTAYPAGAKTGGDDTMVRLTREGIETQENTSDLIIRQIAHGENAIVIALDKFHAEWKNLMGRSTGTSSGESLNQGLKKVYEVIREAGNANQEAAASSETGGGGAFDSVAATFGTGAKIGGAILGTLIGAVSGGAAGALEGYSKGQEISSDVMSRSGEFKEKELNLIQNLLAERNKFMALARFPDGNMEIPRLTDYGMAPDQTLAMMTDIAKRTGTVENAGAIAREIVTVSRATSVDRGTLMGLAELESGHPEGSNSVAKLVSALMQRGIGSGIMKNNDVAGLNDFLGKFAELHRSFLDKQSAVGTATTLSVIEKFNKVGGEFSINSSHGLSNIAAVQDGLTNPASDSLKAFSYLQLRRLNPSAGMFEIMRQQEQGLSGPNGGAYLQSVLQFAHQLGDDDLGKRTLAGFFPKMKNLDAVEQLYNNSDALNGNLDQGYLERLYSGATFEEDAKANTTSKQRSEAEISEGIMSNRLDGAFSLISEISQAIAKAFSGAVIQLDNGKIIIPPAGSNEPLKGNYIQNGKAAQNNTAPAPK